MEANSGRKKITESYFRKREFQKKDEIKNIFYLLLIAIVKNKRFLTYFNK